MPQLHGKQIKDTTIQGTTKLVAASVDTGQLAADAVDQTILDLAATYDFSGGTVCRSELVWGARTPGSGRSEWTPHRRSGARES